jgi:hypothetical protein
MRRDAGRAAEHDGPVSECDRQRRQQDPEEIRVPLDPLAGIEDQAVPFDEIAGVAEGDERVVAGVMPETQREQEAAQQQESPGEPSPSAGDQRFSRPGNPVITLIGEGPDSHPGSSQRGPSYIRKSSPMSPGEAGSWIHQSAGEMSPHRTAKRTRPATS